MSQPGPGLRQLQRLAEGASAPPPPVAGRGGTPPRRPPWWEERLAGFLFRALSPRLPAQEQPPPPPSLGAWRSHLVPRTGGRGTLSAAWFPASPPARGAVLLLHPWVEWGKAYFHRRGRIEALGAAGYHTLTVDLPGIGTSGPPAGFFDRDVEDALAALDGLAGRLPLFVWGVSAGGYWAHPVLARSHRVAAAVFEDVSPHLVEWSWRMAPWGAPAYLVLRLVTPGAYRFLDMRRHAACLRLAAAAYVSGALDRGVRPEDTQALAAAAGAAHRIVPQAGHLESIKRAGEAVIALALATFDQGEGR